MYGSKIAKLRKSANMTQGQLGELLNVSAQAVSKWEHDISEPDLATVKKIADYFNISLDEFLDVNQPTPEVPDLEAVPDTLIPANVPSAPVAGDVRVLGYCTRCGCMVTQENKGTMEPRVLCKKCYLEVLKAAVAQKNKIKKDKTAQLEGMKKKKRKSIGWGLVPAVLIVLFAILMLVVVPDLDPGTMAGIVIFLLFLAYAGFALVGEIVLEGPVSDMLLWFLAAPVRIPGVIFEFSLGGFILLIAMKIVLAALGFLFSLFLFAIGLVVGAFVAPFTYPFTISKFNKNMRAVVEQIK